MSTWKLSVMRAALRAANTVGMWAAEELLRLDLQRWVRESFDSREDDIHIAAFPRAGTTWMQMLLYQLTTNGDLTFEHIYEVSPWLELLHGGLDAKAAVGLPMLRGAESLPSPRVLKTHAAYSTLPRELKGRFIFVTRDCLDMSVSMLHHVRAYRDPNCGYDEIFDSYLRGGGRNNWFAYTREWLVNRWQRPMLVVHYEDMKRDLESVARRIAAFCDLAIDETELPRILERSSFASMKRHQDKFGERPMPVHQKVFDEFIRKGSVGEGRQYASAEQEAFVRRRLRRMPLQAVR